ncbi:low temperature requirement protein A [Hyphomonas sp.]|uniref:low temperature requirement protein A n=1 Tax=Hyphomonas sp. TaxID=87 RepID=UPI00391DACA2
MLSLAQRDPNEAHRASTPLELFVDLASVIAIAAAAAGLHHGVAEGHAAESVLTFLLAFGGIWWAWMNYTWFASAYDDGGLVFKTATFVFLAGALVMAAGIRAFFETHHPGLILAGYVIMRAAMITLWLAAAGQGSHSRTTCLRYAAGILVTQIFWIVLIAGFWQWSAPMLWLYAAGLAAELAVPIWAERASPTPWHRHHIIERYGLLTIIVLGEMLLAISSAIHGAQDPGHLNGALLRTAASGMLITFSMWWVYFCREDHLQSRAPARTFVWGYGHFLVFASAAATGAGFGVLTDVLTGHAHSGPEAGHRLIAASVGLYFAALWFIRDRFHHAGAPASILLLAGLGCFAAPLTPWPTEAVAVIAVAAASLRAWRIDTRSGKP